MQLVLDASNASQSVDYSLKQQNISHSDYTRDVESELNNLFTYLPNPSLFLFIPAHIVSDEIVVPGYTVVIKMYDKDYLALPGESVQ